MAHTYTQNYIHNSLANTTVHQKEGSSNFPAYLMVRSLDMECSTHFLTVLTAAYKDNKLHYVLVWNIRIKCTTTTNVLIITGDARHPGFLLLFQSWQISLRAMTE